MRSLVLYIATKWHLCFVGPQPTKHQVRARDLLVRDILGVETHDADGLWRMFALFAQDGACVATLEAAICPIKLDGIVQSVGALRAVAVRADWRGRGLFKALTEAALAWFDDEQVRATLLFTAEPALYRAFGFADAAQHAFVGPAPIGVPGPRARELDLDTAADLAIVRGLYAARAPLSNQCALQADWPLFAANLRADDALRIAFCEDLDAVVVFERDGEDFTVVDVVAARMPTLAQILGRIEPMATRVKVLFPPDRLAWEVGRPEPEDTGLMIRGSVPAAMRQPFMLPPTVEF